MEKKIRLYLALALLLLIGIGGSILGYKVAGFGQPATPKGSGLDNREIKDLERGLEEGSSRSLEGIEGAIGTAGDLEDRIGRIGEGAEGVGGSLEDIGGIVEELQKRNEQKYF